MARSTLVIRYLGSPLPGHVGNQALDLFLGPGRVIRKIFKPGDTYQVPDWCTADELDKCADWADLVAAGVFSYSFTTGTDAQASLTYAIGDGLAESANTLSVDYGNGLTLSGSTLVADLADAAPAAISMSAGAVGSGTQVARENHTHLLSDNSVNAAKAAAPTSGYGLVAAVTKAIPAGAGGSADDVTVTLTGMPAATILDSFFVCTAGNDTGRTVTLRTAAAGAGSAVTDAFDCATTGVKRNAGMLTFPAVTAAQVLYLRRSDSAVAGNLVLIVQNA